MKKFVCLVLFSFLLATEATVVAQTMTQQEKVDYICSYKWFLRRYETDAQYYTTPKEYQGSYLVFLPQGKLYYHKKGEDESSKARYDWKLQGNDIVFTTHENERGTFKFELIDFIGYKVYITHKSGPYKGVKYVWEQSEKRPASSNADISGGGSTNKFDFSTAARFADSVNKWIRTAQIGFGDGDKRYRIAVTGKTSFQNSSLQFVAKDGQLQLRMNIPLTGTCDYGLKEVKPKLSGQYGSGPAYFYIAFKYLHECNDITYQNIYVFFNREVDNEKERQAAVEAAFKKYCPR